MKIYKTVHLNPGLRLSRKKDLEVVDKLTNEMVKDGWKLEQVVSPNDFGGAIIGFFSKEKDD